MQYMPFGWSRIGSAPMVPVISTSHLDQPRLPPPSLTMEMIGESCPFKGVMSFVIGGALGAGMGVVLTAMGGMGPVHQPGYADPYANAPVSKLVSVYSVEAS